MPQDALDFEIAGNELWRFAIAVAILLLSLVVGKIVQYLMARGAAKMERVGEEITLAKLVLRSASKPAVFLVFAGGFDVTLLFLEMNEPVRRATSTLVQLLISLGIAYFLYRLVDIVEYYLGRYVQRADNKLDQMLVPFVRKTLRIVIVTIAALYIVESTSGRPMSTIIAGLGLGGLAFALAAQESIKNLFGSISILLDQPFAKGDRIVVDGYDGAVEDIGFRSTKIRTLEGHLVTIPNQQMAAANIQNIGKRPHIRRLFNIGIAYDTPPDKVDRAVRIIEGILEGHVGMHPDFPPRVFFNELGESSLNILVSYWYHPADYWNFLAFSQEVNLKIMRAFEEEGIEFAFPTQTVYLANDERRQLALRLLEKDLEPGK